MKLKTTGISHIWRTLGAALAAVLLTAGAGCIHVAINIVSPPNQPTKDDPTREGEPTDIGPGITGGNFVPVQAARIGGGGLQVCQHPVSQYYVRFANPQLWQTLWQTSSPTAIAFQGHVVNTNTGLIIPNAHYYLQWYITSMNKGCATNVAGSTSEIGFVVEPNTIYRFTAFFKNNVPIPSQGHQIQLKGAWKEIEE